MAGSLIKIDEEIVSSSVNSVTLTGMTSDYDVYMVSYFGVRSDNASGAATCIRFTESGTANSTANYDWAFKELISNASFTNPSNTNFNEIRIGSASTSIQEDNGTVYIFNSQNSSEYTFLTSENVRKTSTPLQGRQGGGVFTVTSTVDGIQFGVMANPANNITAGTIKLYGLKK